MSILPFIISGFIAFLLYPLVIKLEKIGYSRTFAILVIYFIFFLGIGYLLYLSIPILLKQTRDLSQQFPSLMDQYRNWIQQIETSLSQFPAIQKQIDLGITKVEGFFQKLLGTSIDLLANVMDLFMIIAVIPFISFYMIKDVEIIKRAVWYMTPKKWRENGLEFLEAVHLSLGGYFRGQLIVCTIVAILTSIAFVLIGVDYPVFLGVIMGIMNIIPYFGPFIGSIPAVLIALLTSVKLAIFTVIAVLIVQLLEGNLISPFVVGKSIQMHPLLIIAALIIGGELFGIVGMVMAVPLFSILKVAIVHARDYLIMKRQSNY